MNVVVIDVPYAWGMILSIIWSANLGGFLNMELNDVHIPLGDETFNILYSQLLPRIMYLIRISLTMGMIVNML
jgi:hypothetical protein